MTPLRKANAQLISEYVAREGGRCTLNDIVGSDICFWSRLPENVLLQAVDDAAILDLVTISTKRGPAYPYLVVECRETP